MCAYAYFQCNVQVMYCSYCTVHRFTCVYIHDMYMYNSPFEEMCMHVSTTTYLVYTSMTAWSFYTAVLYTRHTVVFIYLHLTFYLHNKKINEKNKKCPRETRVRVLPVVHCVVFTLRCTIHVPGLKVSIHTGYKVTPGSWKLSWLLVVKLTKLDEEEKNN